MESYRRTQIFLRQGQIQRLRTLARRSGRTVSHLIRQAIDFGLTPKKTRSAKTHQDPILRLIGKGRSTDQHLSTKVDDIVYGTHTA